MPAPFEMTNERQALIGRTAVKVPSCKRWKCYGYEICGVFPRCGIWFVILKSNFDGLVKYVPLSTLRRDWKII